MSYIPTKHIAGDSAIGRNAAIGGNATVRGNATVDHNLHVKGYLDAPNIKGPMKGLFSSEASLKSYYPNPEPGWYALVGAFPARLFMVQSGDWFDSMEYIDWPELPDEREEEFEPPVLAEFDGFAPIALSVSEESASEYSAIRYIPEQGCFAAWSDSGSKYYLNWNGRENYTDATGAPNGNTIFYDRTGGQFYAFVDGALRPMQTKIDPATPTEAGLMSASDKTALNRLSSEPRLPIVEVAAIGVAEQLPENLSDGALAVRYDYANDTQQDMIPRFVRYNSVSGVWILDESLNDAEDTVPTKTIIICNGKIYYRSRSYGPPANGLLREVYDAASMALLIENQHPQKVIDEETFEALKDAGELNPDTIYYVTEED